ncbi:hypothetical protein F5X99DRAFT_384729 [Biscogniauxia marginata]|nr:hypothetical protein F5X99DRAFT_384729 [Biscogniauxia marginata]
MESPSFVEPPRLDTLPTDVLLIILSHLDIAQSLANLAATCQRLNQLVQASGWRIFVVTCFPSLSLPTPDSTDGWRRLAQGLTSQTRDWETRAFQFWTILPAERRRPNGRAYHVGNRPQSIPGNIIVDAHAQYEGKTEHELVVWGSGEDIFARIRRKHGPKIRSEEWHNYRGSQSGNSAGRDDTTSISIVKGPVSGKDDIPRALVGRANGDLRLLSMDSPTFGRTLMRFHPPSTEEQAIDQREIQAVDYCGRGGIIAAGTKENILLYPLGGPDNGHIGESSDAVSGDADDLLAEPLHSISLKDAPETTPFEFIRSVKFMNQETVAVSLNKSHKPIYYLTVTPTGLEISGAASATNDYSSLESSPRTVRALLPVDVSSVAGGGGNALLSAWDDGTIRLRDLRAPPRAVDRVYQDNFEVSTPTNALVSYGLERFVAGSAHTHLVKIFDYRWPRSYYHSDPLPCGADAPYPAPKPPTVAAAEPAFASDRPRCDLARGGPCRWHALSRHDFYRPNCNVYLPLRSSNSHVVVVGRRRHAGAGGGSPVYSLAKPSDVSPALYAGLSGVLGEIQLKNNSTDDSTYVSRAAAHESPWWHQTVGGPVAVLETGDGAAVDDVASCRRVPDIRRQAFERVYDRGKGWNPLPPRRHRLDEELQLPSELSAR